MFSSNFVVDGMGVFTGAIHSRIFFISNGEKKDCISHVIFMIKRRHLIQVEEDGTWTSSSWPSVWPISHIDQTSVAYRGM